VSVEKTSVQARMDHRPPPPPQRIPSATTVDIIQGAALGLPGLLLAGALPQLPGPPAVTLPLRGD
jgi:hypothetical protein